MCNGHEAPRPSRSSAWRNITTSDLPLPQRLRLVVANSWWKARHRQSCCGHYGEPGC
jgi:hypothetical protein